MSDSMRSLDFSWPVSALRSTLGGNHGEMQESSPDASYDAQPPAENADSETTDANRSPSPYPEEFVSRGCNHNHTLNHVQESESDYESSDASSNVSRRPETEEPVVTSPEYLSQCESRVLTSIPQLAMMMEMFLEHEEMADEDGVDWMVNRAKKDNLGTICALPAYVALARHGLGEDNSTRINAIVGSPRGTTDLVTKLAEVEVAISQNASEIEWVVDMDDFEHGEYGFIASELRLALRRVRSAGKIFSVLLDVWEYTKNDFDYTSDQIGKLCQVCADLHVDFISFRGEDELRYADVKLILDTARRAGVRVKVATGVNLERMMALLSMGVDRIGVHGKAGKRWLRKARYRGIGDEEVEAGADTVVLEV